MATTLFVVLSALEIYVQSDAFARRIRPFVVAPLAEVLGPTAKIGWVKANLVPLFIEVRDISLSDEWGKEAVAIHKVKVYINPLYLLIHELRLSTISILDPSITAERTMNNTLNLTKIAADLKASIERSQKNGGSGYTVSLRTVAIKQGKFRYDDRSTSSQVSASGINITARVNLKNEHGRFAVRIADIKATGAGYPKLAFNLKADGVYDRGSLRLGSLDLVSPDTRLSAEGTIASLPSTILDIRLKGRFGPETLGRFAEIMKPGQKQQGPLIEASLIIKGKATNPVFEGTMKVAGFAYKGIIVKEGAVAFGYRNHTITVKGDRWKLSKEGNDALVDRVYMTLSKREEGYDIKEGEMVAGDLALRVSGRVDMVKGVDASLAVESTGMGKTLFFLTGFPFEGRVSAKGQLLGPVAGPHFEGTLSAGPVTVKGILFNDAEGRLQYNDKKVTLADTAIHQGDSSYVFDGAVDFSGPEVVYTADLQVIRSDVVSVVALFYKQIPLKMSAVGELSFKGSGKDYKGTGRLSLDAGSAYGESFDKGSVTATLTNGRITFPQVVLYKGSGVVKATGWIGFDGTYSSSLTSRYLSLSEVNHLPAMPLDGQFKLDLSSSGSFSHPQVKASLDIAEVTFYKAPIGQFSALASIDKGMMTIKAGLDDKRADVRGTMVLQEPYAWTADVSVDSDNIDPSILMGNKELATKMRLILNGAMAARGNGGDMKTWSAKASFRHLGLVVGDYRIDNEEVAELTIEGETLTVQTLKLSGPGTRIDIAGTTQLMKSLDLTFTGTANLSLLRGLYREVEHGDGVAEVKLSVRDAWNNPDVAGELDIRNGELKIKDIPQKFSALNGKVTFDKSKIVVDSLQGEIGGGKMNSSGWVQLSGLALRDFTAKVSFENVTVRYPEGLTSTLSGDLYYDGDATEQSLAGEVLIKRARYDKRIEWKSMLVDLTKGFYQKKKTDIGWIGATQINMRFHGADNILFQTNLAKMPLDVDVFIRGTVNQPQLLGRIEARSGFVYFRKNDFKIQHASVDFIDPNRMNPMLDIQAATKVREYQISLAVSGSADHALVTLFSAPSLPDADILGLLALGKTSDELKGKETGVGVSEAAYLATGQVQDIVERRARSLTGLDRVQVDPYVSKADNSVPRVTVGKEIIQDKLFVTYSSNVGATVPEQNFRIEYILDKHLSLVGERNEIGNIGADLKFRFEFR